MSDLVIIQPQVTELTVTEDINQVVVSSVGVQGPAGATGAQGPSGVIAVTAPITNSGTSTSANIGVSAGSTSAAGVLQLTDSVSSTSTTTAATPNAVKTAYDYATPKLKMIPMRSGQYYANAAWNNGTTTVTTNQTIYIPFFIPNTVTLDRLQFQTGSTFSGTSSVRLGIYADNGGIPSTLILDAGTVSCTALSTVYSITISQSLTGGVLYWLAWNCQSAATTNTYLGQPSSGGIFDILSNFRVGATFTSFISYFQSSVTGAFANASSLTNGTNGVKMGVRVA